MYCEVPHCKNKGAYAVFDPEDKPPWMVVCPRCFWKELRPQHHTHTDRMLPWRFCEHAHRNGVSPTRTGERFPATRIAVYDEEEAMP